MEKFIEIRTYFWWTPSPWIMQSELVLCPIYWGLWLCSDPKHYFFPIFLWFLAPLFGVPRSSKTLTLWSQLEKVPGAKNGKLCSSKEIWYSLIRARRTFKCAPWRGLRLSRWMSQANTPLISMTSNSIVLLFLYCACHIQRKNDITKSF